MINNSTINDIILNYSEDEYNRFFYNTLKNIAEKHRSYDLNNSYTLLEKDKYQYNSLGYRCEEFELPAELVVAGCSHTYGIGVPNEYVWGRFLSNNLNLSYANLGLSGKSIERIVQTIFAYFKEVGHPKYLCVNFPEMSRLVMPITKNFLISKYDNYCNLIDTNINEYLEVDQKPKYAKSPYFIEEIVTQEFTIWQSINYIQMLEQYCNAANIKLFYGSYDKKFNTILNSISNNNKNYYKSYIDLEIDNWKPLIEEGSGQDYYIDNKIINCHSDIITEDNEYYWRMAGDRYAENENLPHFGIHRHIHFAEIFEKEIKKYI